MARRYDVPGALTPLSIEQLTQLYSSSTDDSSTQNLMDTLADYESDACVLFTEKGVVGDHKQQATLLSLFYAGYVFALLLVDDLNEARFLTHRFLPTLRDPDETLRSSIDLLRAVWSREYPAIYRVLEQTNWTPELRPLVARYSEHFRISTFTLLSKAYISLPPALVGTYLGLDDASDAQIVEQLTARGWSWDEAKKVLRPAPLSDRDATSRSQSGGSKVGNEKGDQSTARLVELIGFLGESSAGA